MIEKLTKNRSSQRTFVYTGVTIWLLVINVWLFYTYHSRNNDSRYLTKSSIYDQYDPANIQQQPQNLLDNPAAIQTNTKTFKDDITIKLLQKQQSKEKDIRKIDAHAKIYDKIFANHEIDSIFGNLNFQQRCDLFFQNLFIDDKNWIFKVNERIELENKHEFKFNDWRKNHLEEYKKNFAEKHNKNKDEVEKTPEFETFIRKGYEDFWNRTMTYEQTIVDHVSILRVFNKCYLTSDNTTQIKRTQEFVNKQHKLIHGINAASKSGKGVPQFSYTKQENLINFKSIKHSAFEHRVYPWLSFEYPIYERFTGEVFYKPPQMSKFVKDESQRTSKSYKDSEQMDFFLNRFKNKCNGKGIVLSIGDSHVDDTVRLIHLLRALNNKLPIQIVYYDDISEDTKKKIVTAGREVIATLPKSFDKVAKYFPEDYLNNEKGLPEQEIWFVNTYNVIHSDYKDKFKKFANKFLATFFNSFEEIMLIDADTVMMQTPEYFFNLLGYKQSGTYFYKDRTTFETRPSSDAVFFKKLGPSIVDSVMFDIPIMTKHTLDTEFFQGLFHYQESGLVMLNRKIHFNALLMMFQLNFYEPVTKRSHGDKELFWLAMAIAGEENYVFDENYAAAIGIKTPDSDRPKADGHTLHDSVELCSPHPGHVSSENNALVWINSGFLYCSKSPGLDFAKEAEQKDRLKHLHTAEEFKAFYTSPLRIQSAIIPPMDLHNWAINNEDEPSRGWFMDSRYCSGYMWCAYSSIGGQTKTGENNKRVGRVIDFSDREQEIFEYYGDVWVGLE